jgi:uncharacterized protein YehS (DUF1456 family)
MTLENVINKLNNIILPKIKRSADFSSLKFSTIFTKNNYNVLTNKINYHYNKIYDYVSENYTTIISNYMNQFLDELILLYLLVAIKIIYVEFGLFQ